MAVSFISDAPVFFHVSVPPPEIPKALIPTVVPEARVLIREAAPPTVSPTLIFVVVLAATSKSIIIFTIFELAGITTVSYTHLTLPTNREV